VKAKEFLSQKGVPYVEKRVDRDRAAAIEMVRLSGQQGVPVIAIDGQVIVGFNKPRLEQLVANRGQRPGLGAQVADAATIALRQGTAAQPGAYVGGVRPGSVASHAGLRAGDIITGVDGTAVTNADDLAKALKGVAQGSRTTLRIVRGGSEQQVPVQF
jgi:S1-C subfamily serine protease